MRILNPSGLTAHRPRRFSRPVSEEPDSELQTSDGGDAGLTPADPPEATENEPEAVEEAVEATGEVPPEDATTIKKLVDWVNEGDVATRAQAVVDQEKTKDDKDQRTTLIRKMSDLILEAESDIL